MRPGAPWRCNVGDPVMSFSASVRVEHFLRHRPRAQWCCLMLLPVPSRLTLGSTTRSSPGASRGLASGEPGFPRRFCCGCRRTHGREQVFSATQLTARSSLPPLAFLPPPPPPPLPDLHNTTRRIKRTYYLRYRPRHRGHAMAIKRTPPVPPTSHRSGNGCTGIRDPSPSSSQRTPVICPHPTR